MAKAKSKKAPTLKKLAQAVKEVNAKVEQKIASIGGPAAIPPQVGSVLIITGGTKEAPKREDLSLDKPVTAEEIKAFAGIGQRVTQGLARCILGGVALPHEVRDRESDIWSGRAAAQTKMSFFKVMECGKTVPWIRDAYNAWLKEKKRYDQPTIGALWKAVRIALVLGGDRVAKPSPMEKFARDCLKIMNTRTLTTDEILREVRALLTAKANYDAEAGAPAPEVQKKVA